MQSRQETEQFRASGRTDCTVNCVTLWLLYVGRPGETSKSRLLQLWTKADMMLDWGSSTLDITTAGIVGTAYCCVVLCIALCWCWQCLLTVGGNWLPHTVTPLDVTTWHNAADSLGTFHTLLNAHKQHSNITVTVNSRCLQSLTLRIKFQQFVYCKECFQHYLTLWFGSWTAVHGKCLIWYCPLRYIS